MKRTLKDWIIATRPWALSASTMSVLVTVAYLLSVSEQECYSFDWLNAVLALFLMAFLHTGGNLISDYYDHKQGVDRSDTLNGVVWIQNGLFKPKEIRNYGFVFVVLAAVIGLILLFRIGFDAIWIGLAGVLIAVFYPWLKFHAMGDYVILLAFALLPAMGTSLAVVGEINWMTVILSLTYGLITVALLHSNNTRDIRNDRRAGIMTLAMQIGSSASHWLYVAELITPYIIICACVVGGRLTPWTLLALMTLPVAVNNCRRMLSAGFEDADTIATLDHDTAQLQMQLSLSLFVTCLICVII